MTWENEKTKDPRTHGTQTDRGDLLARRELERLLSHFADRTDVFG